MARRPAEIAKRGSTGLVIGVASGVVVCIVVIVIAMSGGSSASPSKPAAPKPPAAKSPAPPAPPSVVLPAPVTPNPDFAILQGKVRDAMAKEEFGSALALVEESRPKFSIDALSAEIREDMRRKFEHSRDMAVAARKGGGETTVKTLVERVRTWGVPDQLTQLVRAIAEAAPPMTIAIAPPEPPNAELPPPPPAQDSKAGYSDKWSGAVALAADRDYVGALKILETASQEITDPAVQGQILGDIELLRAAREAHDKALQALAAWPKSQKIILKYLDGAGMRASVEGTIVRTAAGWLEIRKDKGSVFVEFGEILATSIVDILMAGSGKALAQGAALLLLLEGEPDFAKALGVEKLPESLWAHAKNRAARVPGADELQARAAFYALFNPQREQPESQRRGPTPLKMRAILLTHGGTGFVRRNRVLIDRLAAPAREYLFLAADIAGSGNFKLVTQPRTGAAWTVKDALLGGAARECFVELEFEAAAETLYRGWAHVGGCCAESLTLFWQATDLTDVNTKKETISIEPGGNLAVPLKASPAGLPRAHNVHPGTTEAAKWSWVALPLPKYQAAGSKKVRLMASAQGFSVSMMIISATRTSPPSSSETSDLAPPAPEPEKSATAPTPTGGLVGHWALDEGTGATAGDSSEKGFAGAIVGGAAWANGVAGKALYLDGGDDYVDLGARPDFKFAGPFSVIFWMRTGGFTKDWQALVTKGEGSWRVHRSGGSNNLEFSTNGIEPQVQSNTKIVDGRWHHVAAVYDGARKYLYVDGGLDASPKARGTLAQSDDPIWIGNNFNQRGRAYDGLVDDVRLYSRALPAVEVQALFKSGALAAAKETNPIPKPEAKAPAAPGKLLAHWKFDDGKDAKAADGSGDGRDATLVNGPTWVPGRHGGALSFDGKDDRVDAGARAEFEFQGPFSITLWMKVKAFTKEWQAIVTKGEGSWRIVRFETGNSISFTTTGLSAEHTKANTRINTNTWRHVAAVYDGTKKYLYVDGALDATVSVSGVLAPSVGKPVWIGASSDNGDRYLDGQLDDVRIYSRALTGAEVQLVIKGAAVPNPK